MDALDACAREQYVGEAWRVARKGRDPLLGSASFSRWCDGTFDVLYTSLARDGAMAEVDALLKLQPVFPSKIVSLLYRLDVRTSQTLRLADLDMLADQGIRTDGDVLAQSRRLCLFKLGPYHWIVASDPARNDNR